MSSELNNQKKAVTDLEQQLDDAKQLQQQQQQQPPAPLPVQEVVSMVEETGLSSAPPTNDEGKEDKNKKWSVYLCDCLFLSELLGFCLCPEDLTTSLYTISCIGEGAIHSGNSKRTHFARVSTGEIINYQ